MSDSDGEYLADEGSDDDIGTHQVSSHGTRSTGPVRGAAGSATRGGDANGGTNRRRAAWEDIQRSWDTVVEGADGSINSTVESLREASKRKRYIPLPSNSMSRADLRMQIITRHNTLTARYHPSPHTSPRSIIRDGRERSPSNPLPLNNPIRLRIRN